jgi:hypothetical protein
MTMRMGLSGKAAVATVQAARVTAAKAKRTKGITRMQTLLVMAGMIDAGTTGRHGDNPKPGRGAGAV